MAKALILTGELRLFIDALHSVYVGDDMIGFRIDDRITGESYRVANTFKSIDDLLDFIRAKRRARGVCVN